MKASRNAVIERPVLIEFFTEILMRAIKVVNFKGKCKGVGFSPSPAREGLKVEW